MWILFHLFLFLFYFYFFLSALDIAAVDIAVLIKRRWILNSEYYFIDYISQYASLIYQKKLQIGNTSTYGRWTSQLKVDFLSFISYHQNKCYFFVGFKVSFTSGLFLRVLFIMLLLYRGIREGSIHWFIVCCSSLTISMSLIDFRVIMLIKWIQQTASVSALTRGFALCSSSIWHLQYTARFRLSSVWDIFFNCTDRT